MAHRPEIERLIQQVAQRHQLLTARQVAVATWPVAAAACAVGAIAWVARGHAVPAWFPLTIVLLALLGIGVIWAIRRMSREQAAHAADQHFDLKDAIVSARHLALHRADDDATAQQWQWLKPRLETCDAQSITAPFPKRSALWGGALTIAAVVLCLLPASPAIRAAELAAQETRERVNESKEELEKVIEELSKDLSQEEKEAAKLDEVRQMVKAIDQTGDRAEAARQFARIEQKVREASRALDQRREEETLHLAAKELAKAEETEPRKLGKKLDAKELKEAAEMLKQLAAKELTPKDFKNATAEQKKQKLSEAKQELARLRAASKRLAAAGKQRQGQSQVAKGAEGAEGANKSTALEDILAQLDEQAAAAEKEIAEQELDPNAEPNEGQCQKMGAANKMLDQLGKRMRGMHGKRLAQSKLDKLSQCLSQSQAFCQGQSQTPGSNPGGKKAGTGSSWQDRKERDDSQKNGQLTQLQGQHGTGPSLSAVEEADQGSGTSNRHGAAKQREFARQTESFVQRDDVPESLKLGVRNYFESLQSGQNTQGQEKEPNH